MRRFAHNGDDARSISGEMISAAVNAAARKAAAHPIQREGRSLSPLERQTVAPVAERKFVAADGFANLRFAPARKNPLGQSARTASDGRLGRRVVASQKKTSLTK